jgi:mRNA interferase MazF
MTDAPSFRLPEPNPGNALRAACRPMVDKITAVPKSKIGQRIGSPGAEDIVRLNRSMPVFLGLAASSRALLAPYIPVSSVRVAAATSL